MRFEEVERVGCGFEVQTLLRLQMSRIAAKSYNKILTVKCYESGN